MADVQIAIIDQQNTQIALAAPSETEVTVAVPGIQGPVGEGVPSGGTTNQVLFKQSGTDYDTAWSEVTSAMIGDLEITNADVAANAEIAVSKLADGDARQLLQTDAAGTGVEWTSNVDVPGTLDVTGATTLDSTLTVPLGSAASPTLRFSGDANSGLYSPGADQVAVATNGTRRLLIDSAGALTLDTGDATIYGVRVGRGGGALVGNTVVGNGAFQSNTTGYNNTANGTAALYSNTTGVYNTANGYDALRSNTTGSNNVANGASALYSNTTGYNNTANGAGALYYNTTGVYNTANGYEALKANTTGGNNTANGSQALFSNTTGSNNTCYGFTAGYSLTTGSNNTIIGTILGTAGLANTVIIGAGATERLRIDSSGNVGIGTSAPSGARVHSYAGNSEIESAVKGEIAATLYPGLSTNIGGKFLAAGFQARYGVWGEVTNEGWSAQYGGYFKAAGGTAANAYGVYAETGSADVLGNGIAYAGYLKATSIGAGGAATIYGLRVENTATGGNISYGALISTVAGPTTVIPFRVDHAGSTRFTINSSGQVGIGTTSPAAQLNVSQSTGSSIVKLNGLNGYDLLVSNTQDSGTLYDFNIGSGSGAFSFTTSAGERARIDSSGRLLVGTSSTSADVRAIFQGNSNGNAGLLTVSRATNNPSSGDDLGYLQFADSGHVRAAIILAQRDGGTWTSGSSQPTRLVFSTTADGASSPTERMRINNAGILKVSNNSTYDAGNFHQFNLNTGSQWTLGVLGRNAVDPYGIRVEYTNAAPNGTVSQFLYCIDTAGVKAEIRSNGGLANYQANDVNLSDRNVKKDISPAADTWNCLKEWEIVNYRYKDQPDDADLNLGVIAQQVAESCPEVITVFQEAKDDQPEKLGVKEQQMYWMAIKALQEAQARIEALEAKVVALESKP